jgi:hypothetical protein
VALPRHHQYPCPSEDELERSGFRPVLCDKFGPGDTAFGAGDVAKVNGGSKFAGYEFKVENIPSDNSELGDAAKQFSTAYVGLCDADFRDNIDESTKKSGSPDKYSAELLGDTGMLRHGEWQTTIHPVLQRPAPDWSVFRDRYPGTLHPCGVPFGPRRQPPPSPHRHHHHHHHHHHHR